MTHPILLIEDTPSLQLVYESVLKNAGYDVVTEGTAAGGLSRFNNLQPKVVLLDLMLPDRDGLDLMKDCLGLEPTAHFIVITSNGSINRAVEAMRAGAYEFLVKPFDERRLLAAIENAIADQKPGNTDLTPTTVYAPVNGFIGTSPLMTEVYSKIRSVSRSMATVFITGESGTGKEVCAQAVHDQSHRASGPFVPLNCSAIPSDLLESEVFGHLKGSFTGAISDKIGAAAAADGGTLFLDEICEMDPALQTKLLRFLQTSTIQPVGAIKPHKVNVRIICATNRDPVDEVRRGRFREDLFYRLHVIAIDMPPLRERGEDIIDIANYGLARYAAVEGRSFTALSENVKSLFRDLPWPGNVRQLLNVLRNVVVLHDGSTVTMEMLPANILRTPNVPDLTTQSTMSETAQHHTLGLPPLEGKTLAEIERLVIEDALARHNGSVPKAARELDVSPSTLYRKRENWISKTG